MAAEVECCGGKERKRTVEEKKKLCVLVADMAHLLLFEQGVPYFHSALGPANPGSAAG